MVRVSARVQELKRICWLIVAGLLTACSPPPSSPTARTSRWSWPTLPASRCWSTTSPLVCPLPAGDTAAGGAGTGGQTAVVMVNYDPATPAELAKLAGQYHIEVPLLIARQEASPPSPAPPGCPPAICSMVRASSSRPWWASSPHRGSRPSGHQSSHLTTDAKAVGSGARRLAFPPFSSSS